MKKHKSNPEAVRAAVDLLVSLLQVYPPLRCTADKALDHEFFWMAPAPSACHLYITSFLVSLFASYAVVDYRCRKTSATIFRSRG